MPRSTLIAANWKMTKTIAEAESFVQAMIPGLDSVAHCRLLIDLKIARKVTAYDIAEGLVEAARAEYARDGYAIDYRVEDLNFVHLPRGAFDLCLAMHALHHCVNLEDLLREAARALKPGSGRFVTEDYVGPRYLEFPRAVRRLAQTWLERLPERLRRLPDGRGTLDRLVFRDRWLLQRQTPFEAIRSDSILPAIGESMEVERLNPLGGGLLMPLLDPIIHNFDPDDDEANAWIERILDADSALTHSGEVPNCYAFVVARPKP
jgi:SAM-dependent methyltransferase